MKQISNNMIIEGMNKNMNRYDETKPDLKQENANQYDIKLNVHKSKTGKIK